MKSEGKQIRQLHGGSELFRLCEAVSKDYLMVQNDCQPYICIQRREGEWETYFLFKDTFQEAGDFISAWIPLARTSYGHAYLQ